MPATTCARAVSTPTCPSPGSQPVSLLARRDVALVQRILDQRDERAYAELLRCYWQPVYHIALKMVRQPEVAEDLTLEVFSRAFRFLPTFKPAFAFSTWLFRIATNCSISYLRRPRLRTVSLSAAPPERAAATVEMPDLAPTPPEALIALQRSEHMHRAVGLLPAKYRQVLQMHYFEELSYEEIAACLHLPLGTVKGRLHRGRHRLQGLLAGGRDDL